MRLWYFFYALLFFVPMHLALAQSPPETLLVGLFINTKEEEPIDALKINNDYFIPFDTFNSAIAIKPAKTDGGWEFNTPIGNLTLPNSAIRDYQGTDYVNTSATTTMGIPVKFNQSNYAISIYPPWNISDLSTQTEVKAAPPNIDYYPNTAGLNIITINGGVTQQRTNTTTGKLQKNMQIGFAGHAFGGLWGGQLNYRDSQSTDRNGKNIPVEVNRLYWATFGEQTAFRLGTNTSPSFYSADSANYSGVTVAYSNQSIRRHLSTFNQYNSTLLQNSFDDFRTISGEGPVGGVAELRINHRSIARVRIGLDKRYEFRNLNMSQLYDAEYNIDVALYEHNFSNQPIEIIPYTVGKRQANVSTNELLLEAGIGQRGNALDKNIQNSNKERYSYGYAEYGLTNNIALRAGISYAEHTAGLFGMNVGFGPKVNWDLSYRKTHNEFKYQSLLSYSGKKIGANYQFDYQKNTQKKTKTTQNHALYFYIRPTDAIDISLNAYEKMKTDKVRERYFTANANIRFSDTLYASINRDRHNDMRYQLNWNVPEYRTTLSFSSDKYQHGIAIDHQLFSALRIGAEWQHPKHQSGDWYKTYIEYEYNKDSKFFANATHYLSQTGYQLGWQQRVNNGFDLSLGYHRNGAQSPNFNKDEQTSNPFATEDQHYFYLQFNIALMHVPGSGYTFGQYRSNRNLGNIIAQISYDDDLPINSQDVTLQIDGKPTQATRLNKGKYLIENLKPGIYQLSLDNKELPIEYSTDNLPKPKVKVTNAATTVVPYHLEQRFGFSGKIHGINENSQPVTVDIYQDNEKITSVTSNTFGYYQVLGLKAGDYTVKTKGYRDKQVTLVDSFLFEIDLRKE